MSVMQEYFDHSGCLDALERLKEAL